MNKEALKEFIYDFKKEEKIISLIENGVITLSDIWFVFDNISFKYDITIEDNIKVKRKESELSKYIIEAISEFIKDNLKD